MNYLFLDNGFEEIEAVTTIDLLRRAGVELTTVSMTGNLQVNGAHGITVKADALFADIAFADTGMLILPGGGVMLGDHEELCNLLRTHNDAGGMIAAICAAPAVLGKLGILEGKQATCYPGFEEALGESYVGGLVVESKNVITAKGPGLSSDFAFCLIEKLKGAEVADEVYDAAQY
ncbi:MAG: DJ-1/PfpI family protein [Paludibacteraceae bacterium]|nr:DJ-1/PfpI family protein [Paludibacteraceae bacterium]MBQ9705361.1 DJ-1/PfpI family protein [Paludibacteraceae bacterium]